MVYYTVRNQVAKPEFTQTKIRGSALKGLIFSSVYNVKIGKKRILAGFLTWRHYQLSKVLSSPSEFCLQEKKFAKYSLDNTRSIAIIPGKF